MNVTQTIASVIINSFATALDKPFDYIIPNHMQEVCIGVRVIVPFGLSSKPTEGFVVGLSEKSEMQSLKEIAAVIDKQPLFNENMLLLAQWMKQRYLCTLSEVLRTIIPTGLSMKFEEWITLCVGDIENIENLFKAHHLGRAPVQRNILESLNQNKGRLEIKKLQSITGIKNIRNPLIALYEKGLINIEKKILRGISEKTKKKVSIAVDEQKVIEYINSLGKKYTASERVLRILLENEYVDLYDLLTLSDTKRGTADGLRKKGLIRYVEESAGSDFYDPLKLKEVTPSTAHPPTKEQENAIEIILRSIKCANSDNNLTKENFQRFFLLHGVTGSGKTEVFMQLIREVISIGKQAIVLVPEISLTPQMIERFISRFGKRIAVIHSRLTLMERYTEWLKIKRGEVDIVIGARSAVFAPFERLGIIVLDEEHETTYKGQTSPRYDTIEVAKKRCDNENAILILSSATPSMQSYYNATHSEYGLITMKERYNKAQMPSVEVVDMRLELMEQNKTIFSRRLTEEINYNLSRKQQTILFINRRGHSASVSCRNCGYVVMCKYCNISMPYHLQGSILTCHYCGYKISNPVVCPKCDSKYIKFMGIGTEKVEQAIKDIFPTASVIRMDVDTTGSKFGHEKILNKFKSEGIDILVGTQMVTKGLDFPNVTLVGILAADMSLNIDDFRSSERTFQLLTQVSGRAGRGDIPGRSIIQTYNPDNYTIRLAQHHDYIRFYSSEIKFRQQMMYPPFTQIAMITVAGAYEKAALERISRLLEQLKALIAQRGYQSMFHEIYKIIPAPVSKIKNKYRFCCIIKCADYPEVRNLLREINQSSLKNDNTSVIIDINPTSMY